MTSADGDRPKKSVLLKALVLTIGFHLLTTAVLVGTVWEDETTFDQYRLDFLAPSDNSTERDSHPRLGNSPQQSIHNSPLLTCNDIQNIPVLETLGKGKRKRAFSLQLPNGEIGIAKRCRHPKCYRQGLTTKEGGIFKTSFEQHGSKALRFFGDCHGGPLDDERFQDDPRHYTRDLQDNFTIGYTFVIEVATPLLAAWHYNGSWVDPNCFAQHYTEADVADLASIAHRYAALPEPLYMGPIDINQTDNMYPQQYAITQTKTGEVASIQHTDLDWIVPCRDHGPDKCTYKAALDYNCQVISQLVNRSLDCSETSTIMKGHGRNAAQPRINTTLAKLSCLRKRGKIRGKPT